MKNHLKVERARLNFTQQDLADRLSVSRQTIIAIESGKFNPSTQLSLKMARLFGLHVEDLFELEEEDGQ